MNIKFPVNFDYPITITYEDNTTETSIKFPGSKRLAKCTFSMDVSGTTLNNIRLTNLTGYNGGQFLKRCPRCNEIKPFNSFGEAGRYTNNTQRDQSNCNSCRARY